jgi:hypothetical protein
MSISSIFSPSSPSDLQAVSPTTTPSTTSVTSSDAANGVSVDISRPGQLFSQLSSLAQSNPDQFKSVTADIAAKLKDAAGSATGSQADFLNKIADRFQSASQSGSISDLQPPQAQGGGGGRMHGHHHHHGGGGGGGASSTGGDGSESVGQILQGIISGALSSVGSTADATTTANATTATTSTST